jgi:hypothetical protein
LTGATEVHRNRDAASVGAAINAKPRGHAVGYLDLSHARRAARVVETSNFYGRNTRWLRLARLSLDECGDHARRKCGKLWAV